MGNAPQNYTSKDALKHKAPVDRTKDKEISKDVDQKNMKGSDCGC